MEWSTLQFSEGVHNKQSEFMSFLRQDWSRIRFPWRLHLSAEGWELLVPRQQNEQWVKMSSDFGQFLSHFNEIETAHHSAEVGFAAVQLHCETQMGRHPEAARFAPPSTNPYHFSLEKAGPRKAGENPPRFQQFSVVSKSQNWFWTSFMSRPRGLENELAIFLICQFWMFSKSSQDGSREGCKCIYLSIRMLAVRKGDPAPKSLNSILTYRKIPQDTPSMYRALGPPVIASSDNT